MKGKVEPDNQASGLVDKLIQKFKEFALSYDPQAPGSAIGIREVLRRVFL
ncbi:MAG TPA: hypothetical protein VH596_01735 [Terriglobales bacterium]|jgi:hypothetical protein